MPSPPRQHARRRRRRAVGVALVGLLAGLVVEVLEPPRVVGAGALAVVVLALVVLAAGLPGLLVGRGDGGG